MKHSPPCTLAHNARVAIVEACEAKWLIKVGALYATLEQGLMRVARSSQVAQRQPRKRSHIPTARTRSESGGAEAGVSPDWIARFFSLWEETPAPPPGSHDLHARGSKEVLPRSLHQLLQSALK